MKPETTEPEAEAPRFRNRTYRAELERTAAGGPVVTIIPLNPAGRSASRRQIAAFIYELASEMELGIEALGAKWVVAPEAWNARLNLGLASEGEATAADAFVRTLLADRDLA